MTENLTQKQNKFVEAFVETGVGAEAARAAYDIPPENNHLAAVVASENLTKPDIQKAIEAKKEERAKLVEEATKSLLTAVKLDYFVFPSKMTDEEIVQHVEAQGITCLNVRKTEKGKMAFFAVPDGAARAKGVEIHHKVEGTFAPEKKLNVNVEVEASQEILGASKILNDYVREHGSLPSVGADTGPVGAETQNQE